jgi:8-oxo-dGTP pyrophosphatase MutT (NUDIX family)
MLTNNILYAAGVLFYSKSIDQTPYFLLGKDYDNKWSNFGGRSEINDRGDFEVTAAREAWEETLGAVYDYSDMKNIVKNKSVKHFEFRTPSGHPYYMFLIKIPFTTTYRDKFLSTKRFISNTDPDKKFLEINDIKWVSLDTIKFTLNNKRNLIKLRTVFENNLSSYIDEVEKLM